jgi:hypothetical protein
MLFGVSKPVHMARRVARGVDWVIDPCGNYPPPSHGHVAPFRELHERHSTPSSLPPRAAATTWSAVRSVAGCGSHCQPGHQSPYRARHAATTAARRSRSAWSRVRVVGLGVRRRFHSRAQSGQRRSARLVSAELGQFRPPPGPLHSRRLTAHRPAPFGQLPRTAGSNSAGRAGWAFRTVDRPQR